MQTLNFLFLDVAKKRVHFDISLNIIALVFTIVIDIMILFIIYLLKTIDGVLGIFKLSTFTIYMYLLI